MAALTVTAAARILLITHKSRSHRDTNGCCFVPIMFERYTHYELFSFGFLPIIKICKNPC